ncbi:nuclear transport factor 2 family protein [Chryseobacterium sp. Tr-659]|uniref:AtzH-like domain-containing protein n=1 Tax=Chryseobacterium sp. Tr-659 TaxID=2608340 RepID=UPI00141E629B|nr:AtzH-like domain-containing protein [Chryseobacterium sp. Tr-659]NIF06597.1 nuclear transport factor 2 family protein [Chryseobacterium sp. Tr-659]
MALSGKKDNRVKDYQDIVTVLENYTEGLKTGNVEQLQQSFHKDAIMYGYWDEYLVEGGITNLYDSVRKHGTAPHIKTHIDILHTTDRIALARIEYERNAADKNGMDYHALIKVNDEWKIISKLFQTFLD